LGVAGSGGDDGEAGSMVFVGERSSPVGVVARAAADGDCGGEESGIRNILVVVSRFVLGSYQISAGVGSCDFQE
jgi:hypothetical protein